MNRRTGFTFVEAVVAVLLFFSLSVLVWQLFIQEQRGAARITKQVELQQRARMAGLKLTRDLQEAVEILYPPIPSDPTSARTSSLVVYLNGRHELAVVYVDDKGRLVRQNRTKGDETTFLAEEVARFRAFRKGRRLLNFHLHFEAVTRRKVDGDETTSFDLLSGATLRNAVN